MRDLSAWLAAGPLLTDGAWGTELQARGLAPGHTPDLWNLEHPLLVEEVARAYVEAGSQIILTNTFRANAVTRGEPMSTVRELNRAGVEISRRAAGERCRVVASMGPTGKMLFAGEVTPEQVREAFAGQAAALAEAGADALLLETMSDIQEAVIALEAARTTGLPVIVSFAFDSGRNKDRTMMGATPEHVAAAMEEGGASAVGTNCGSGIEHVATLCRRLRAGCGLPVWAKPNAGMPEIEDGKVVYRTTPQEFASYVPALLEAGASFVGGCCGSNPDFIRALAAELGSCVSS